MEGFYYLDHWHARQKGSRENNHISERSRKWALKVVVLAVFGSCPLTLQLGIIHLQPKWRPSCNLLPLPANHQVAVVAGWQLLQLPKTWCMVSHCCSCRSPSNNPMESCDSLDCCNCSNGTPSNKVAEWVAGRVGNKMCYQLRRGPTRDLYHILHIHYTEP